MIKIELSNGLFLTVEQGSIGDYQELYIGITNANENWLQDIAIIGQDFHSEDGKLKLDDAIKCCVFADHEDEDYTNEFKIKFWEGAE